MFVLQNAPMPSLGHPSVTLTPLEATSGTAKFDLTLSAAESPDGLHLTMEYSTDLFERGDGGPDAGPLSRPTRGDRRAIPIGPSAPCRCSPRRSGGRCSPAGAPAASMTLPAGLDERGTTPSSTPCSTNFPRSELSNDE